MPSVRARRRVASAAASVGRAVAGAELAGVEVDLGRVHGRQAGHRAELGHELLDRRPELPGRGDRDAVDDRRQAGRCAARPAARPGCRPSPTARPGRPARTRRRATWSTSSRPRDTWPIAPVTPEPPIADHRRRRPAARRSATTRSRSAARSARSSVAAWWTVAPSSSSSTTPGLGGSVGGPDRTRWTSRPARAPAAAVSRAWFDQRRPDVTRHVGTLGQRGPDEVLQVAQLVPAEGQRQQVLALDPQLGAAAEGRRQARQRRERRRAVEQREPREAGRIGGPGRHAADGTRPYHRPMADAHLPGRPAHDDRPARRDGALDRDLGADGRVGAAVFVDRVDRARRPDPGPPPRRRARRRSTSCPGAASYTLRPDRRRARVRGGGRRLRVHPGRRDPRRGERVRRASRSSSC